MWLLWILEYSLRLLKQGVKKRRFVILSPSHEELVFQNQRCRYQHLLSIQPLN